MKVDARLRSRRPRLSRPVVVLTALVVGLGGVGAAAGAVLGELGSASSAPHHQFGHGHHDDDDGPGPAFTR